MSQKEKIILIGGGGHCKSVIDIIETENKFQIAGILDLPEKVGKNCIINNKAFIEHEAVIEDNIHTATGAIINGACKVEKNCFIGCRAKIIGAEA